VRAPVGSIAAPPLPVMKWANVAMLRMDKQVGHPVLVEFWDFCRVNSLRTLPYVRAWHERYAADGLRVIAIHSPGFAPSQDPDAVRAAVTRLDIEYPVALDVDLRAWRQYDVPGWPARYLFDQRLRLFEYHHGEGDYDGTERAIGELLGREVEPVEPVRPEDAPGAILVEPTPEQPGPYCGPYGAGGVHLVVSGSGEVVADGERFAVEAPGVLTVADHPVHVEAELALEVGAGVEVHATCFTAGLDDEDLS
jgi:thiol-disulfide isomerase/thioredoxin